MLNPHKTVQNTKKNKTYTTRKKPYGSENLVIFRLPGYFAQPYKKTVMGVAGIPKKTMGFTYNPPLYLLTPLRFPLNYIGQLGQILKIINGEPTGG